MTKKSLMSLDNDKQKAFNLSFISHFPKVKKKGWSEYNFKCINWYENHRMKQNSRNDFEWT